MPTIFNIEGYSFDFTEPLTELGEGSRVLLEAPQGFVQYLPRLAAFLEEHGLRVYMRLDPAFGGCDIGCGYASRLGVDAVIHIGHERYPLLPGSEECRVYYVPGEYVAGLDRVSEFASALLSTGCRRVALAYSAQHRLLAGRLAEALRDMGFVVEAVRPILGCYHYGLDSLRVDAVVVVAGGLFHALGLALRLGEPGRVLPLDPYSAEPLQVGRLRECYRSVLARRLWLVSRAMEGRRFAVIDGRKPGQHRPWLIEGILRAAGNAGFEVDVYISDTLSRDYLLNLRPGSYDAFIVASCPRIPIEDYTGSTSPIVLTPGEFMMAAAGRLEGYVFPW
ncbi:MAG: hypothetical protein GXO09_05500 [Crenarchaeota archaeon]|nr:hypothetical protein [Thermoproteota archaeon]